MHKKALSKGEGVTDPMTMNFGKARLSSQEQIL